MSAYDGLGYYYDELGLQRSNFLLQFNSGSAFNYSGVNHPEFRRSAVSGAQAITNASGLNGLSNRWSHFFIYEKTNSGDGVLFSNFQGHYPYSGYTIGVTDDHKIYFESYDNNGPVVKVGKYINSNRNAIAVTKNDSTVAFNYFDFNAGRVNTESFAVQNRFVLPSNVASLGGPPNNYPAYTQGNNFPGNIETYAYMTECCNSRDLNSLFSGFYSYPSLVPGPVTSYSYTDITGYQQVPYYYTGVTGYQTIYGQIGTGRNGNPISGYYSQPLSGQISGGYNTVPLSGTVTIYQTGDSTYSFLVDSGYANSFKMNGVAIFQPPITNEFDSLYSSRFTGGGFFNQVADYDSLKKSFELDQPYNDMEANLFLNGSALSNMGYSVTGNVYQSGYQISGDYFLNNLDVILGTGFSGYNRNSTMIYDIFPSGTKQTVSVVVPGDGRTENLKINASSTVFLNGSLLTSGVDYTQSSGYFKWVVPSGDVQTSPMSGYLLTSFNPSVPQNFTSGSQFTGVSGYQRGTSRLFANGYRLTLNTDYVENGSYDFLRGRSILESGSAFLYNDDGNYFES